jgi:peptide-methionine (S)-S-oxide reductase
MAYDLARRGLVVAGLLMSALAVGIVHAQTTTSPGSQPAEKQAVATFAGGCFWCVEEAFEKVPGVISAVSGYTGGTVANPSYEQVSSKKTGHAEAVRVTYDPSKVSYQSLVDWFWHNIDPVDAKGQFCDKGSPYRSAIFVHDEEQKKIAEASKKALEESGRFKEPIATEILPAGPFYEAEDYHQNYYKVNPVRYQFYKHGCGRAARLEQIWGKPTPPPTH